MPDRVMVSSPEPLRAQRQAQFDEACLALSDQLHATGDCALCFPVSAAEDVVLTLLEIYPLPVLCARGLVDP